MIPDFNGMFKILIVGSAIVGWLLIEALIWLFSHLKWSIQ